MAVEKVRKKELGEERKGKKLVNHCHSIIKHEIKNDRYIKRSNTNKNQKGFNEDETIMSDRDQPITDYDN